MPREVKGPDGIAWTCIQAFAGLENDPDKVKAARVDDGRIQVVCTPSGGARSVRLTLAPDWEEKLPDEGLLKAIERALTPDER